MVHTLTVTAVPFSVQTPSSAVAFESHSRVFNRNRRAPIRASAVAAETPMVLERRRPANTLYEMLKVKQNASVKEIKSAYRNLAKLYHPDAAARPEESADGRNFIEIHDAYATLFDPSARELYDLKLSIGSRPRRMNGSVYYPTQRWKTDQCW